MVVMAIIHRVYPEFSNLPSVTDNVRCLYKCLIIHSFFVNRTINHKLWKIFKATSLCICIYSPTQTAWIVHVLSGSVSNPSELTT